MAYAQRYRHHVLTHCHRCCCLQLSAQQSRQHNRRLQKSDHTKALRLSTNMHLPDTIHWQPYTSTQHLRRRTGLHCLTMHITCSLQTTQDCNKPQRCHHCATGRRTHPTRTDQHTNVNRAIPLRHSMSHERYHCSSMSLTRSSGSRQPSQSAIDTRQVQPSTLQTRWENRQRSQYTHNMSLTAQNGDGDTCVLLLPRCATFRPSWLRRTGPQMSRAAWVQV
jgi:hypothetical protein